MGLDSLAGQESESVSRGKSTHIKFWNPRSAVVGEDIPEDNEHLHKQDYYDAAKRLRDMYGPAVNIPVGEFMVAAVEAEEGNPEPLRELFETIADEEGAE